MGGAVKQVRDCQQCRQRRRRLRSGGGMAAVAAAPPSLHAAGCILAYTFAIFMAVLGERPSAAGLVMREGDLEEACAQRRCQTAFATAMESSAQTELGRRGLGWSHSTNAECRICADQTVRIARLQSPHRFVRLPQHLLKASSGPKRFPALEDQSAVFVHPGRPLQPPPDHQGWATPAAKTRCRWRSGRWQGAYCWAVGGRRPSLAAPLTTTATSLHGCKPRPAPRARATRHVCGGGTGAPEPNGSFVVRKRRRTLCRLLCALLLNISLPVLTKWKEC